MSKKYFADLAERAVKTFAQSFVAVVVADNVVGVLDLDWAQSFSVAGLAALLSVGTSVASRGFGEDKDSAGLV